MFNLNDQISKWRSNLAESQTLETPDMDELESHLREEIEHLMALKLSQEEAFYVARHRLGDTGSLAEEFAKINGSVLWSKRLFWAVAGLFGYVVATYIAKSVTSGFLMLAWFAGVKGHALGILDVVLRSAFFLTVIFVVYEIVKRINIRGRIFGKLADNLWGIFAVFTGVFAITAAALACRFLVPATVARMSVKEWSEMALFRAYIELIWVIVSPLILLTALIYLRPSKLRKAAT